jgi:NADP-dependent 3-hydroxy acid dehydrogenase YdfG
LPPLPRWRRRGPQVTLVARKADALEATAAAIRADGGQAHALPLDITDLAATAAVSRTMAPSTCW